MSREARRAALESLRRDARPSGPSIIPITLAYDLPVPLRSDTDDRRLANADLDGLSFDELRREASRTRDAIDWGDLSRPSWAREWLETRLRLCRLKLRQLGGDR